MHRFLVISGLLAALLAPSGAEAAQEPSAPARTGAGDTLLLSLSDAQRRAVRENPAFLADRQEAEIARGNLRQARVYNFNPEVEFEAPGANPAGGYEATLTQEIEWAGQRSLRVRAARIGLARTESAVRDAARLTLAETSRAFYAALAADRRLRLAEGLLSLSERLFGAVRIQLREGEISALEANLAEIEFGRSRARVVAARREATSALLELKRHIGLTPDRPVILSADLPSVPAPSILREDSLVALALARRPDLEARAAAVDESQILRRLARREALPNLRVGALAEGDRLGGEPRLGVGIGFSLPVFDRNQGIRAQRAAQADQAALQARAVELRIRTEVTDALRAYRSAAEEVTVLEESVLEPARQNRALLETAYQAGKVGLPEVLLLRNQLLDAELGYWEAWLAQREALVALHVATAALGADSEVMSEQRGAR
jgi:cobalt-zinc-cadmium efflux system outer membrane protein